ncbi:JAB domain-containing protein [Variovorax sp. DT-64]|uniref:JAB domain-containing protein n=1 Tax=Variovorax sp. DT-64 TaxID=3396160 RepID=UPI003F1AA3B1
MDPCNRHEDTEDERCIRRALQILEGRIRSGPCFGNPAAIRDFLRIRLAHRGYEVFAVLWLDAHHRLIEFDEMFRGTVSQASVYPREMVREAIRHNACACILSHNHPSGCCQPSPADMLLTHILRDALAMLDVRVLDHIIVSATGAFSMAEHDLS